MKTIRIEYPDWQAGNNPLYYFGSELLAKIVPNNAAHKVIKIEVEQPNEHVLALEDGIVGRGVIEKNLKLAQQIIEQEAPDKIITIGGDCLVSQVPFDYLHGKYQEELGVIWIDAHPDISNPDIFNHAHAMVLANLLHIGDKNMSNLVKNPFKAKDILYLGVQHPTSEEQHILNSIGLNVNAVHHPTDITTWLQSNNFNKVVVHLDLDVLNPKSFHSLYFNSPSLTELPENAAIGKMDLQQLSTYLTVIFASSNVVGLSIAEYLPWDASYLRNLFNSLNIFK